MRQSHQPHPSNAGRARADLHVHSKRSNRPTEWLLQRISAPESFTEPLEVYRRARERGMDFVTLSDHDTVEGALEIAHLPGVFLSSEVTVSFPEDGCQIHCLVAGVTEEQHREIQRLKGNVYDFRDYVTAEGIFHSVAHPLYRVNDRLELHHVEKLLVLFDTFEARNGIHDRHLNDLVTAIFSALTPEIVFDLAERHRLEPRSTQPWKKAFTGGSDDHGGLYIATTWTETPAAATVEEYLGHLAARRVAPGGDTGSALRLARSLFTISHQYYRDRFAGGLLARNDPFARLLAELGRPPAPSWRQRIASWLPARRVTTKPKVVAGDDAPISTAASDDLLLDRANRASARLVERFARRLSRHLRRGRIGEAVGAVAELAPLAFAAAPYAVAFRTQYKDEHLLAAVRERFPAAAAGMPERASKAWVTDTLTDVNGVARTIRAVGRVAERRGLGLTTLTCSKAAVATPGAWELEGDAGGPVRRFEPLGTFALPGYESLELSVPPFLELLDCLEKGRFGEVVISTPGPMGLAALGAARLLGLPVTGVYHTDFPLYVRYLTGDPFLEETTWGFMRWFFRQMDRLYVPSRAYGDLLVSAGFDGERIALMPRSVDAELFHPARRAPGTFSRFVDVTGAPLDDHLATILSVGRVSKEKNLDLLVAAFERLRAAGRRVQLAVVGDGPYRTELAASLRRRGVAGVALPGFLQGEELARVYASATCLGFPSTSDTFGNAVLEAAAAGVPAVVTDLGGPQEIVRTGGGGLVVSATLSEFTAGLDRLVTSQPLAQRLGRFARRHAQSTSWATLLDRLWGEADDLTPWRTAEAPLRHPARGAEDERAA